jgi:small-conductance mechanosensitive channel
MPEDATPEESARAEARLAALQRDEALDTLAGVRRELTRALQEHRANEQHLADAVRVAQTQLLQARDTIHHMERSIFWRARQWWIRVRGGR